jgi:hypothetical protein
MKKIVALLLIALASCRADAQPSLTYCEKIDAIAGDVFDMKAQDISSAELSTFYSAEMKKKNVQTEVQSDVQAIIYFAFHSTYQSRNDFIFKINRMCIGD